MQISPELLRFGKVMGVASVTFGSIVGFATAFPYVEPYLAAHRGYVREQRSPLLERIIEVQLQQNDNRTERLVEKSKQYELELQSDQAKALPQYRALVQDRVDRIKHELKTIDEKNNSLFKEKASGR